MSVQPGFFVAVVGPSGAGKDTILSHASGALAADGRILFVRRRITRPAGAGEDHEPIAVDDFSAAERRGEFALVWRAHGLSYGIPASVDAVLADGSVAIANVSRGSIPEARRRFERCAVVHITASPEVRLARIRARGREDLAAARARVARSAAPVDHDLEIVNDGTVAEAGQQLVRLLTRRLAPVRS